MARMSKVRKSATELNFEASQPLSKVRKSATELNFDCQRTDLSISEDSHRIPFEVIQNAVEMLRQVPPEPMTEHGHEAHVTTKNPFESMQTAIEMSAHEVHADSVRLKDRCLVANDSGVELFLPVWSHPETRTAMEAVDSNADHTDTVRNSRGHRRRPTRLAANDSDDLSLTEDFLMKNSPDTRVLNEAHLIPVLNMDNVSDMVILALGAYGACAMLSYLRCK